MKEKVMQRPTFTVKNKKIYGQNWVFLKENDTKSNNLSEEPIVSILLQSGLIMIGNVIRYTRKENSILITIRDINEFTEYHTSFKLSNSVKKPYEFAGKYCFESYESSYILFKQDNTQNDRYVLTLRDDDFEISWYYTLVNGKFVIDQPVYADSDVSKINFKKTMKG